MNTLQELIKKAQGNRSQNEYAQHAGVSSAAITRILKNQRRATPDTLRKLADRAYNNVTYNDLMVACGYYATPEEYQHVFKDFLNNDTEQKRDIQSSNTIDDQTSALKQKKLTEEEFLSELSKYLEDKDMQTILNLLGKLNPEQRKKAEEHLNLLLLQQEVNKGKQ